MVNEVLFWFFLHAGTLLIQIILSALFPFALTSRPTCSGTKRIGPSAFRQTIDSLSSLKPILFIKVAALSI